MFWKEKNNLLLPFIVDEEAAKVVRRIFDLCIAGKGPMQIAKILTADKVLTVTAYNARQNCISGVLNRLWEF